MKNKKTVKVFKTNEEIRAYKFNKQNEKWEKAAERKKILDRD